MLKGIADGTNIVFYLMLAAGAVGILAKIINQLTLSGLTAAAKNMPKSTHRLAKLIKAKYEHACMAHGRVDNVGAFIGKYLDEYKGFLFKVYTWGQIQRQSIYLSVFLAVAGAASRYMYYGFDGGVFQYIFAGAAQAMGLYLMSRLSDEAHKMAVIKNYMVDYFENVCVHRYKKAKQTPKEELDVIFSEPAETRRAEASGAEPKLPIHIEGEPRDVKKDGRPMLKEEAIRRILEEFLA